MPRASTQNARPALRRLTTRPSRIVQAVVSRLLPLLFRSQGLELSHRDAAEALAKAFAAQLSGGCNLLIAFRHPSTRDPVVMADLFWNGIPRAARRLRLQLPRPIQLRFLYDRGIPIWAGPVMASVGAELARAEAALPVQTERIKQVTEQLQADIVAPAESECQTMMAEAKGEAATIIEQGRSQAEGLRDLVESLKRSGNDAKRLFLLQKLEPLLTMLSDTVQPVEVEEVSLVGEKSGGSTLTIATLLKQLQQSTGLQLPIKSAESSDSVD